MSLEVHYTLKISLQIYDCEIGVVKCFGVYFYTKTPITNGLLVSLNALIYHEI